MIICIQTLKRVSFLVAFITEEKVIAVFTHPTILQNHFFAVKTIIYTLLVESRLHYHLEFVIASVVLTCYFIMKRTIEETLLAYIENNCT